MTGREKETPVPGASEGQTGHPARERQTTADKTLDILLMFSDQRPVVHALDVARQLGVARSTAYRYLLSLTQSGFLEETEAGGYRLGQQMLRLSRLARRSMKLTTAAHDVMRELALDVSEVVLLTRMVDGSVICLERADGAVGEFRISHEVGQQLPLNANASAYALLAWLPEEEAHNLLVTGNLALSAQPRASVIDGVMCRLAETREQGYSVSRAELDPEIVEVAAPIRGKGGTVVGAISVTAVSSLVPDERIPDLAGAVHRAANMISDRLTA